VIHTKVEKDIKKGAKTDKEELSVNAESSPESTPVNETGSKVVVSEK
jgi:hypothetical protein